MPRVSGSDKLLVDADDQVKRRAEPRSSINGMERVPAPAISSAPIGRAQLQETFVSVQPITWIGEHAIETGPSVTEG
jgi:hypothetical protein